jgi:hypothetical protein
MELVCSILHGIQMTLKEALADQALTTQTKFSIKVQDFKKVNMANIKFIDVLQSNLFEVSSIK